MNWQVTYSNESLTRKIYFEEAYGLASWYHGTLFFKGKKASKLTIQLAKWGWIR